MLRSDRHRFRGSAECRRYDERRRVSFSLRPFEPARLHAPLRHRARRRARVHRRRCRRRQHRHRSEVRADLPRRGDSSRPPIRVHRGTSSSSAPTPARSRAHPSRRRPFGSEDEPTGQRSDTIMVVHVEPDSRTSFVVSFPRDLWVDIPESGESKINAAFNDGPQKVIDTLQAELRDPDQPLPRGRLRDLRGHRRRGRTGAGVPPREGTRLQDRLLRAWPRAATSSTGSRRSSTSAAGTSSTTTPRPASWSYADAIPDLGRIARQQNFIRRIGSLAYRAALGNPLEGQRDRRRRGPEARGRLRAHPQRGVQARQHVPHRRPGGPERDRDAHAPDLREHVRRRPVHPAARQPRRRDRARPAPHVRIPAGSRRRGSCPRRSACGS